MKNFLLNKEALSKGLGILAWISGAIIGRYSGINLLIPLAFTATIWWATSKYFNGSKKLIIPAFSINAGHFLWLGMGILLTGIISTAFLDIIVYLVGLIWLFKSCSKGSLYLLGIYQTLSLFVNVFMLIGATFGTNDHKALLIHVIWRAMALFFISKLYYSMRKNAFKTESITS